MSTLQIRKLESGAFEHVDSIDGNFFLGRFSFKNEFNIAFLVEAYGAKRREYTILEITVFDYLGVAEIFTNWTDLINRLVVLGYTGIDTNSIPTPFNPDDYDLTEFRNEDVDPFVRVSDLPAPGGNDFVSYFTPRMFIDFPTPGEWLCSNNGFVNSQFLGGTMVSCGSGSAPSSTLATQAVLLMIPVGYIVDEILVNLNYKAFNTTDSTLEFFIQREETNGTTQVSTGSNAFTISNDTLITTTGSTANLRRIESLAINSHSLPSLAFSYLQIAIRETQNASYNALSLEIKFKKP